MRRLALILALLLLTVFSAAAEDAALTLRTCTTIEEAEQFVLMPPDDDILTDVQAGYIRYIAQKQKDTPAFRKEYWRGGEPGSVLDLNLRERYGIEFPFYAGIMCTRAAYSMAMSCLGINLTPGDMSALTCERNLDEPYDDVSALIGVERIERGRNEAETFNSMLENYLTDDSYSPVCVYLRKPDGSYHALLVVARMPSGRLIVVDSNPYFRRGKPFPVYFISLNLMRSEVTNSTFKDQLLGSKVLQIWQWRLVDPAQEASAAE